MSSKGATLSRIAAGIAVDVGILTTLTPTFAIRLYQAPEEQATGVARFGLRLFGVDDLGLDKVDRAILSAMCEQFNGGPVGLSTVAISVGEQPDTVEDVYEPFLIQQGMIARTPRGRVAMPAAYQHLGLAQPSRRDGQGGLFDG